MALALGACASLPKVRPDAWCPGRIEADDLRGKLAEAWSECAPMIRITVET